jgi:hypothetical protein
MENNQLTIWVAVWIKRDGCLVSYHSHHEFEVDEIINRWGKDANFTFLSKTSHLIEWNLSES